MANFWDLPKDVRETIYRLHLVREEGMKMVDHVKVVGEPPIFCCHYHYRQNQKRMPPICRISPKFERETAPIYYGENHFEFRSADKGSAWSFADRTYPRHLKLVRKVTIDWPDMGAYEQFLAVARMRHLEELNIGVDEVSMVSSMTQSKNRPRFGSLDPTPQQQLTILRHPGMTGLLATKGVRSVNFIKQQRLVRSVGGPIRGGMLEMQIKPRLMAIHNIKSEAKVKDEDDTFRFLDLPPELRNRVYGLLLQVDGPIHPTTDTPSSAPKAHARRRNEVQKFESALSILAVNRQINDETVGMFYHENQFEFYYPTQLHAFLLSLSAHRQAALRDITLHYYNTKVGGINLTDLTFPLLKQLTGLRRLHIIANKEFSVRYTYQYHLDNANPVTIPGMRTLFDLRGITNLKVRDTFLERQIEDLKKEGKHGKHISHSPGTCSHYFTELEKIMEFFNQALADAQTGKVNKALLDDKDWHTKKPFPTG